MTKRFAVILAAGQGTRMKSRLYKVLHPVCGKPMVEHVIDHLSELNFDQTVTIVGHGAELVQTYLEGKSEFALQEEQLGTAHAVGQAKDALVGKQGTTLVICGDTPLIKAETMQALIDKHEQLGAKATILTAKTNQPDGYGRIVRNQDMTVEKIVEHKDATEEERSITEINTGTYCFDNEALFEALELVSNDNVQGEYYLPDVIEILKNRQEIVSAYQTDDFAETLGVNDRVALAEAESTMRKRINEQHMRNGVTIQDPESTYIDADVIIGSDTVVLPGTSLTGKTEIMEQCQIGPNSEIKNSKIGTRTIVKQSVVHDSIVGEDVQVGPFAHIRPESTIHNDVKVGNFVEVKKAEIGNDTKISHLSYIGDAIIGEEVNVGCGSITVNYDGTNKHQTVIGNRVFVGCNSNLVAPVKVEDDSFIAAGSTITMDVPSDALAIARAKQVNKEGYIKKLNLKK